MSDQHLQTELVQMDPRALTLLEKNAHFMPERTFKQLVSNIERDGCLTSAPLAIERGDKWIVLSGNHRVKASLAAGLTEIPVLRLLGDISDARQVAIQLSHNALVGEDDPNLLQELYDSLDVLEQRYSGLTDADLGVLDDPDLQKLNVGLPSYDELIIAFLPSDLEGFQENLEQLKAKADKRPVLWAKYEHYQEFFAAFLAVKEAEKISNDGIALLAMSQLALEHIEQSREDSENVEGSPQS